MQLPSELPRRRFLATAVSATTFGLTGCKGTDNDRSSTPKASTTGLSSEEALVITETEKHTITEDIKREKAGDIDVLKDENGDQIGWTEYSSNSQDSIGQWKIHQRVDY